MRRMRRRIRRRRRIVHVMDDVASTGTLCAAPAPYQVGARVFDRFDGGGA